MSQLIMRRITLEDVPALSFIAKKTFYDTFIGTCSTDDMEDFLEKYYNEKTLAIEVADPLMQYYFAEMDGERMGYILFSEGTEVFDEINDSSALELKRFYILQEYHGKGVAQKMMNFLLDEAKKQDYEKIFLGVWEFNYRAQKFYNKFNFVTTSHKHDFPIGNTAQTDIYMWRNLV